MVAGRHVGGFTAVLLSLSGCSGGAGDVVVLNPADGLPIEAFYGMDVADANADGYTDLVAVSHYMDGTGRVERRLNVFTNDPLRPGKFGAVSRLIYEADDGQAWDVIAADLGLDGLPDIVVRRINDTGLWIFAQDPAQPGTYLAPLHHDPSGAENDWLLGAIAVGRVDGDIYPDAVATSGGRVIAYLQDPAAPGAFAAGVDVAEGSGAVVIADVTGDGDNDLVTFRTKPNDDGIPTARSILIHPRISSDPAGYGTPVEIPLGSGGGGLGAADLDGDGRMDIVLNGTKAESGGIRGRLQIFRQTNTMQFVELDSVVTRGDRLPRDQVIVDLDQDGDLEIVVSYRTAAVDPNQLEIFSRDGAGDYVSRLLLDIPDDQAFWNPELFALRVADLDADGRLDIAVSTYEVFVFFQDVDGFNAATRVAGQR